MNYPVWGLQQPRVQHPWKIVIDGCLERWQWRSICERIPVYKRRPTLCPRLHVYKKYIIIFSHLILDVLNINYNKQDFEELVAVNEDTLDFISLHVPS